MTDSPIASWELARGDEIVPGLIAMKLLGGGSAYEAYLAFDQKLYAPVVVKVIRPDQVADDDDNGDDNNRLRGADTHTRTGAGKGGTHTRTRGHSGRHTRMSRDRDHSRGGKVRDWTHDGRGDHKRDFSANMTNDGSRHDTRGR